MIRLLDKTFISFFNYFFISCFIVIFAGNATEFARNLGDIRTSGNAFAIFITVLFIIVNKVKFGKEYFIVIGIFLAYALITTAVYGVFSQWWVSVHFMLLTYAYVLCKGLGNKLVPVYETVMYHMSIISLFFWIIMLISPSALTSIVNFFSFSAPHTEGGNVTANMIIYTLSNWDYGYHEFNLLKRNPGFSWEPGAFASMICLALFCNLMRTNFRLSKNLSLKVFLVTLFSTQSTTGIIVFLIMVMVWLIKERKIGWYIMAIPIVILLYNLSFVGNKLNLEQENLLTYDVNSISGTQGRFISLTLDWQEFLRHPLLGLGCNFQATWLNKHGYEIHTVSGVGDLLATYGGVIAFLFVLLLFKSSACFNKLFQSKNGWVLIFVILGTMISYTLWKSPIFIAFWLFYIFGRGSVNNSLVSK